MRSLELTALAFAACTAAAPSMAQDAGNWLVRARAVNLDSANKDSTGLGLSVNNKVIPEVDISYFYSRNLAVELILSVPQKHTLYTDGAALGIAKTAIGTLRHLPPTVTAQWHFSNLGALRPYLGAGLNFTRFSSVDLATASAALGAPVTIKKNSWGLALQAGVDYALGNGWYLNADVKKVQIKTDVWAGANKAGTFKVDPTLLGLGVGLQF